MRKFLVLGVILLLATPAFAIDLKDVELGGKVQLRGYEMDNFWDFNDDSDIDRMEAFRTYTSLQTKLKLSDDVAGFVKITNQTYGSGMGTGETQGENRDDRLFVDNAYIDVNNMWCLPKTLNLRLGRQNMMYGSGFVLFDGQSQYASTSLYFDGVKGTLKFSDKAVLDAFYLNDQEYSIYNNPNDDIWLSGAYFTGKCPVIGSEKGQQEIYMLNRVDKQLSKNIWMPGIRLSDKFDMGLDYSLEGAYQFGKFNDDLNIDQDAWGVKLDGGYTFSEAPMTPRFFLGYSLLGGNDPDTKDCERWDVFYGGWPQWGDLLAWHYVNLPGTANAITDYDSTYNEGSKLTGEAVYSNLNIGTVGIGAKFPLNISAQFSYSMLTADQTDPGKDDDIGDYYQLTTKYSYSPNLDFSIYAAMLDPGKAFVNDDMAYEFYWETALKF
jgi:hypothetical protein